MVVVVVVVVVVVGSSGVIMTWYLNPSYSQVVPYMYVYLVGVRRGGLLLHNVDIQEIYMFAWNAQGPVCYGIVCGSGCVYV